MTTLSSSGPFRLSPDAVGESVTLTVADWPALSLPGLAPAQLLPALSSSGAS